MKAVLFGVGFFGQLVYNYIIAQKTKNIEIVGVADNNYKKINKELSISNSFFKSEAMNSYVKNILSCEEVKQLFFDKIIDGCIICILDSANYLAVKKQLTGVKIIDNICENRFCYAKDLGRSISLLDDLHMIELENIYMSKKENQEVTWLYSDEHILYESFNYPYEICREVPDVIFYENEYEVIEEDVCVLARDWTINYWHFIHEVIGKILLLEENGYKGYYMIHDIRWGIELLKLVDIDESRIIWIPLNKEKHFLLKKVWLLESIIGSSELLAPFISKWSSSVMKGIKKEDNYPKRIFIKRIGTRKVKEENIKPILEKYGFVTIVPEEYPVIEQIKFFRNADIVISPHGAGSANCLFMEEGKAFIELFGFNYVCGCNRNDVNYKKLRYQMIVEVGTVKKYEPILNMFADYEIKHEWLENAILNAIELTKD